VDAVLPRGADCQSVAPAEMHGDWVFGLLPRPLAIPAASGGPFSRESLGSGGADELY
jgi:hypothetical protein